MPVNLQELRTAVREYLNTKVTLTISTLTPARGATINQSEDFTFSITAANATVALGGIALKNVCYHLRVRNPSVAELIVPPAPMVAHSGQTTESPVDSPVLAAGAEVVEMYLTPADEKNYLTPGESDTISNLRGRTKMGTGGTGTVIEVRILAEVDMNYLFPTETTSLVTRTLAVV
jgi:hypothetical protein